MAADREIIREFLASLGYQVDQPSARKFIESLQSTSKLAAGLGKTLAGLAVAGEAMVDQFAFSMEKLYYSSRRTKSSVESLQAVSFGFRQIGLAGEGAIEALESMAATTRTNPGLRGLLDSLLGKKTEGMDQMKVMMQLVERLSKMPHFMGAQFAQMFGMDEKTFFMMKDQLPQLAAAEEKRRQMNRGAGIDAQKAAEASHEYANTLGEIWERVKVLRDAIAIELLPTFREFATWVNKLLQDLAKDQEFKAFIGQVKELIQAFKGFANSEFGQQIWTGLKNAIYAMVEALSALLAFLSGDFQKGGDKLGGAVRKLFTGSEEGFAKGNFVGGQYYSPVEIMRMASPQAAPLGAGAGPGGGVTVSQKTDIHVSGAGDPKEAARLVLEGQARLNADLRDLVGNTR